MDEKMYSADDLVRKGFIVEDDIPLAKVKGRPALPIVDFRFQNMLVRKGTEIRGAMSPFLFAQDMCKQLGIDIHGLTRVWFNGKNEHTHQQFEKGEGWTGYDTLILAEKCTSRAKDDSPSVADVCFRMFIDCGVDGIPVAVCFASDLDCVTTEIYLKNKRIDEREKLSQEELNYIFAYLQANPQLWEIQNYNDGKGV